MRANRGLWGARQQPPAAGGPLGVDERTKRAFPHYSETGTARGAAGGRTRGGGVGDGLLGGARIGTYIKTRHGFGN